MQHKTADAPKTAGHVIHSARVYDLFGKLISFGRDSAIRERLVKLAAPASGRRCSTSAAAPEQWPSLSSRASERAKFMASTPRRR